jgi:hypothetical protein
MAPTYSFVHFIKNLPNPAIPHNSTPSIPGEVA